MSKLSIPIILLAVLLAACSTATPTPLVITATPAPPTVLPITATVAIAPSWTPTKEAFCTNVSTDHRCFINTPINPGYDFTGPPLLLPANETRFSIQHLNGSFEGVTRTVQYPGPQDYYNWRWRLTGATTIPTAGWITDIFYRDALHGYAANITSASGELYLELHQMELQADQEYVAVLEYTLDLFNRDSRPYAETFTDFSGKCEIFTDAGLKYSFPVQGLSRERQSWTDTNTLEEVAVSFRAARDLTVVISCGWQIAWPTFEGAIVAREFRLVPIDWQDSDIQRVIR